MIKTLEIKPKIGFGEINFGESLDNVMTLLGKPQEIDSLEEDEELNILILHYWDMGFSIIFEGVTKQVIAGFETDHPDAEMYGKKVMGMTEEEVVNMMKEHGYAEYEKDIEDGDTRISYDDLLLDFYLKDGKVIYVNWGVYVNEDGEVEEM